MAADPTAYPVSGESIPPLEWIREAWRSPELQEAVIAELAQEISQLGELPQGEQFLPVLNRALPREDLLSLYLRLREYRVRPEGEWRPGFELLLPSALPLPPTLESAWQSAVSPQPMFELIHLEHLSDRKQRLFLAACCRSVWDSFSDPRARQVVDLAEQYADGLVSFEELKKAGQMTEEAMQNREAGINFAMLDVACGLAAEQITHLPDWVDLLGSFVSDRSELSPQVGSTSEQRRAAWDAARSAEEAVQADLLREVLGNPFHYDPGLCDRDEVISGPIDWESSPILPLCRQMYAENNFDQMERLADLLEQAGCADQFLLDHCRKGRRHVRGCWVVDLLLHVEP